METLFARVEHGGHRVVPTPAGFQVEWPMGTQTYPSARQTIIALVNQSPSPPPQARDPHLTFDRYFRQGKYLRRPEIQGPDIFDLFRPSRGVAIRSAPKSRVRKAPVLTVHQPKRATGIDLAAKGHEVRKLFYAGFGRRVLRKGYDPEDVLQEIYTGLLVRNNGKCPFDASKSTFGHYVHMVAGCILSNYDRRYSRLRRNETFGACLPDGSEVDVAEADLIWDGPTQEDDVIFDSILDDLIQQVCDAANSEGLDPCAAVETLHFLRRGQRNKEIVEATGLSTAQVSKLVKLVKETSKATLRP